VRKFYFTNRVVDAWNSLPNWIVMANSTNTFKCRLDILYCQDQEIIYDFRAQLQGTESHSDVSRHESSSSRMCVLNHNWSATKQRPHPQSAAEISHHSVLSGDRIQQSINQSIRKIFNVSRITNVIARSTECPTM